MTKILIVEDDALIAEDLAASLTEMGHEVLGKALTAESALHKIKNLNPELILLDIELSGEMNGIEIAEIINLKYEIPFIYVTSFFDDPTVAQAKETKPAGYILKPFDDNDIRVAVALATAKPTTVQESKAIYVRVGAKLEAIEIASIEYIMADDNYCQLHLVSKKFSVHQTLKELKKQLSDHGFFQCHRSFLIQISAIKYISEDYAYLSGAKVPIGKNFRQELLSQLRIL